MIDRDAVRNYAILLKEIEIDTKRIESLRREIERTKPDLREVSDVVTHGKRGKKPLKTSVITGCVDYSSRNKKTMRLQTIIMIRRKNLERQQSRVVEAERVIASIEDDLVRTVVKLRCLGYSDKLRPWREVAMIMGEGYTPEALRKVYQRAMQGKG